MKSAAGNDFFQWFVMLKMGKRNSNLALKTLLRALRLGEKKITGSCFSALPDIGRNCIFFIILEHLRKFVEGVRLKSQDFSLSTSRLEVFRGFETGSLEHNYIVYTLQ